MEDLLEPLKLYQYELSYKHQDNIDAFFNGLTDNSGIDIEANRQTCREYYGYIAKIKEHEKKRNGQRDLRVFLTILTVIFFVTGTIFILLSALGKMTPPAAWISGGIALILLGIFFIVLNCTIIAKNLDRINKIIQDLQEKANKSLSLANQQMACLNSLYDWGIPAKLMSQTTPLIQTDQNFGVERYTHLVDNYHMKASKDENVSTVFVQSGTLLNNPFLYERDYIQEMYQHTYTGSIVISWTTTSHDSKGNIRTVHHTQTLTATITRPAARYYLDTVLLYANEAAPRLSFSRNKGEGNSINEKDLSKFEAKWDKKLHKMQEQKVKSTFTPLSNSKFEGLFGAFDRDNEVEFRLLFTPLAQKSMIDLLISKKPYGDDFSFVKRKMINIIRSDHAQNLDFDGNPYHFQNFDYDKAKEYFTNYNMKYFQGIFYDFIPLLSIPVYQQHKEYVWEPTNFYKGNTTEYEAEVLANFMDEDLFKPEDCDTHIILKAHFNHKVGKADVYEIHSYGFQLIPRVEIVPKLGGDGLMHNVPVHWKEYIPVEKESYTAVIEVGGTKQMYLANIDRINTLLSKYCFSNDIIFQRGLLSFPLSSELNAHDAEELIKIFSHKEA